MLFLAGLALALAAAAQDRRPAVVAVHGVGTHTCGKYIEFKEENNETMRHLYQQWAAGYMAGYGSAVTKPGSSSTISADLSTYTAWLDKWCADDPSSNVLAGIAQLRQRILSKK
jgi:hypothetical protein